LKHGAILGFCLLSLTCSAPTAPGTVIPEQGTNIVVPPGPSEPVRLTWTLSGVVYESAGDRRTPLPDARVVVAATGGGGIAISDATGRYEISRPLPINSATEISIMGVIAEKSGYSQPCRPSIEQWRDGIAEQVDIYLVADAILESTGIPRSVPVLASTLAGRVLERRGSFMHPVAGARVMADYTGMYRAAQIGTVSDANGRYFLCGFAQPFRVFWDEVGDDFPEGQVTLHVSRRGFITSTVSGIDTRSVRELDLELSNQ
jgi:hypothetical protein